MKNDTRIHVPMKYQPMVAHMLMDFDRLNRRRYVALLNPQGIDRSGTTLIKGYTQNELLTKIRLQLS